MVSSLKLGAWRLESLKTYWYVLFFGAKVASRSISIATFFLIGIPIRSWITWPQVLS